MENKTYLTMTCLPEDLKNGLQIFDLKQLADMEALYRRQCKNAMADYKKWGRAYADETDMIALLYGKMEGTMLRRRAEDAIMLYWTIRKDFRRWFHSYQSKTKGYTANANTQS